MGTTTTTRRNNSRRLKALNVWAETVDLLENNDVVELGSSSELSDRQQKHGKRKTSKLDSIRLGSRSIQTVP